MPNPATPRFDKNARSDRPLVIRGDAPVRPQLTDLSGVDIEPLRQAAAGASRLSYSPYSGFPVGAAVLTESGEVFAATNVENASYGLTICAERNAIFHAVVKGSRKIKALLIYTPTGEPTAPCGACRQVLYEFGPQADIFSVCDSDKVLHHKLSELLPEAFGPQSL